MNLRFTCFLLLALAHLPATAATLFDGTPDGSIARLETQSDRTVQDYVDDREREPGPVDAEGAMEIAVERYGGKVAGVEEVVREGKEIFEVRIYRDDGSVRTVRIDPDTGKIIPQESTEN